MARAMGANREVPLATGKLRFTSTRSSRSAAAIDDEVRVPALEQSNTAVFFGNRLFLKGFRRMREGVNPELEMGRFLTEVSPYPEHRAVLGARRVRRGRRGAGDARRAAALRREPGRPLDAHPAAPRRMLRAARRRQAATSPAESARGLPPRAHGAPRPPRGELHRALCRRPAIARFDPEP
jgi:maltose alpha-D-glucosyltransferase/alpha-amylase